MTDYTPSLVVLLEKTALKHVQVLVVGSLGMLRSYGSIIRRCASMYATHRYILTELNLKMWCGNKQVYTLETISIYCNSLPY